MMTLLFSLMLATASPADTLDVHAGRQIVDAADLRQAGITRLSDIWRLVTGWGDVSVDGFRVDAGLHGPALQASDGWLLLVDGHPVDVNVLGVQDLNALPIALEDIAFVELIDTPIVVAGRLAAHGVVHIHLLDARKPPRQVQGTYWTGNEIGDAGPFKYLGDSSYVERLGPGARVSGIWTFDRLAVGAAATTDGHHPTDPQMLERVRARSTRWPKQQWTGGSAYGRHAGTSTNHRGFVMGTRGRGHVLFAPFGREVEGRTRLGTASFQGVAGRPEGVQVSYRTAISGQSFAERANPGGVHFTLRRWRVEGSSDVAFPMGRWRGQVGVRSTHTGTDDASMSTSASASASTSTSVFAPATSLSDRTFAVYAQVQPRGSSAINRRLAPSGAVEVERGYGRTRIQGFVSMAYDLSGGTHYYGTLSATVSHAQRFFAEAFSAFYGAARGLDVYDRLDLEVEAGTPDPLSRVTTVDVHYRAPSTARFAYQIQGRLRTYANVTLMEHALTYDPEEEAFGGPVRLVSNLGGRTIGAAAWMRFEWASAIRQDASISFEKAVSGDGAFVAAWDARQRWHAQSRLSWTPVTTMSLVALLRTRSATVWNAYADPCAGSCGAYAASVSRWWTADVSIVKWLWGRRVRGTLGLRNLFNQENRQHPLGATEDLSMILALTVRL